MTANAYNFPGPAGTDPGLPGLDDAAWENLVSQFNPFDPAYNTMNQGNNAWYQNLMSCQFRVPPSEGCPEGTLATLFLPMVKGLKTLMRFIDGGVSFSHQNEEPETQRNDTAAAPDGAQQGFQDMGTFGGEATAPVQATDANVNWGPSNFPTYDDPIFDISNDSQAAPTVDDILAGVHTQAVPEDNPTEGSSSASSRTSTPRTSPPPVVQVVPVISDENYGTLEESWTIEEGCPESLMDDRPRKSSRPRSEATKCPRTDRKKKMKL